MMSVNRFFFIVRMKRELLGSNFNIVCGDNDDGDNDNVDIVWATIETRRLATNDQHPLLVPQSLYLYKLLAKDPVSLPNLHNRRLVIDALA